MKKHRARALCPFCQRPYRTRGGLQQHIQSYHAQQLAFQAEQFKRRTTQLDPIPKEDGMLIVKK